MPTRERKAAAVRSSAFRRAAPTHKLSDRINAELQTLLSSRSHCDHFSQHSQAVAEKANFTPFSVVPADRNFPNAQSGAMREKKQLNIKSETVNPRRLQNWPTNVESKCLEPALGVPKWKAGCNANKKIENTATLFSPPGLMYAHQAAIERTRSQSNVDFAVCNRLAQFWRLCDRCGKICVRKKCNRFSRGKQSGADRRALPAIWKIFQQAHSDFGL